MKAEQGSGLLEALLAALVLATGVLTMAQLASLATRSHVTARRVTMATILAEQKIEQLRGLAWGITGGGALVSDLASDTTVLPPSPGGGTGLQPFPAALQRNIPGFVDHLDAGGVVVGRGPQPPAAAVYLRRWSVEPLAAHPDSALIIQVLVTPHRDRGRADEGAVSRLPGEARLVTIKVRKAP